MAVQKYNNFLIESKKSCLNIAVFVATTANRRNRHFSREKHQFYDDSKTSYEENATDLAKTVIVMLMPYIGKIRSITTDNGGEFAEHLEILKKLRR